MSYPVGSSPPVIVLVDGGGNRNGGCCLGRSIGVVLVLALLLCVAVGLVAFVGVNLLGYTPPPANAQETAVPRNTSSAQPKVTAKKSNPQGGGGTQTIVMGQPVPPGIGRSPGSAAFGAPNPAGAQPNHTGVDFGAPLGTKLLAIAPCKVVYKDWWPKSYQPSGAGHGWTVSCYLGKGTDGKTKYAVYAHMSKFMVEVGQILQQGDVVGLSGQSGYGSGPHLHFAIANKWSSAPLSFPAGDWDNPNDYLGKSVTITQDWQQGSIPSGPEPTPCAATPVPSEGSG